MSLFRRFSNAGNSAHNKVEGHTQARPSCKFDCTFLLVSLSRDLRARLELAVDHILEACSRVECLTDTDCTTTASNTSLAASEESSSSHSQPEFLMNSPLVTTIVRRELAVAIRDLMQHGMVSVCSSTIMYSISNRRKEK